MKNFIGVLITLFSYQTVLAQTILEKVVAPGNSTINFNFNRPELIVIKPWDGEDIKLRATVDINKGENDDAFDFTVETQSGEIIIASIIKDYKNISRKITLYKNGQEYIFDTDDANSPEVLKFKEDNEGGFDYMNIGIIMDITVEIWVPRGASINVYSKFGLVEVVGYTGNMTVHSKFGGIDVSTGGNEEIEAGTKFGEKYTNLTTKVRPVSVGTSPGSWDWIKLVGNPNSRHQELKSEFGNIYIRKL